QSRINDPLRLVSTFRFIDNDATVAIGARPCKEFFDDAFRFSRGETDTKSTGNITGNWANHLSFRYSSGTSANPHCFSCRDHAPRLSRVTFTGSIGMITGTSRL